MLQYLNKLDLWYTFDLWENLFDYLLELKKEEKKEILNKLEVTEDLYFRMKKLV